MNNHIIAVSPIVNIIVPPPAPLAVTLVVSLSEEQSAELVELYNTDLDSYTDVLPGVPLPTFEQWLLALVHVATVKARAERNQ